VNIFTASADERCKPTNFHKLEMQSQFETLITGTTQHSRTSRRLMSFSISSIGTGIIKPERAFRSLGWKLHFAAQSLVCWRVAHSECVKYSVGGLYLTLFSRKMEQRDIRRSLVIFESKITKFYANSGNCENARWAFMLKEESARSCLVHRELNVTDKSDCGFASQELSYT
jgi:hypothetical protein